MRVAIVCIIMLCSWGANSQENNKLSEQYSEYSINLTPMVLQVLPFQNSNLRSGPFGFVYKHFNKGKGLKLALGADISSSFEETSYLNLALGFERKRELSAKYAWYQSYDLIFSGGSLNLPTSPAEFSEEFFVGLGLGLGGEYRISEHIALGTESVLLFGISDIDGFNLKTIPPIFFYLRFRK